MQLIADGRELNELISTSTSLYLFCTYHNPVTFLFPALSRIPSPNSTASFLPQTPYRPISALTPPPLPFKSLPSAINCIPDYYYLFLSLLYICIGVNFFMFCYFYLVFYVVKRLRVFFFFR
jgi:hypothetical protein